MRKVLITGVSSGLGRALAERILERGDQLFALGRREPAELSREPGFLFLPVDLSDPEMIPEAIREFIDRHTFDLVILNAGRIEPLKLLSDTPLSELRGLMEINLWANKQIIDTLDLHATVRQVVAVSSGAAVNGSKGWGGYALSKAALNMLIKLYAAEKPWIHFSAIAPGVVKTPMLEKILRHGDAERYPSLQKILDGPILPPEVAAERFLSACESALEHSSSSFLDVRSLPEKEIPL